MKAALFTAMIGALCLVALLPVGCRQASVSPSFQPEPDYGAQVDTAMKRLSPERQRVYLDQARQIASGKIFSRPYTREDLLGHSDKRTPNGAIRLAAAEKNYPQSAQAYALAMTDTGSARQLLNEMGLVAAAYRVTHDELYRDYLVRQLTEVAQWNPFQRPGYSVPYQPGGVIPAGGDGAWLGTGYTIHAIVITLDILPSGTLPAALESSIRAALRREIISLADDWKMRRPWFVRDDRPDINQSLVPLAGAVSAGLMLGKDCPAEAFQLARAELERGIGRLGTDGTMNDGFLYAMADSGCDLFIARHFLARAHDSLAQRPFFDHFPRWICFYYQPGGYYANAFDTFSAQRGNYPDSQGAITRLTAITHAPELHWLLRNILGGSAPGLFGLLVEGGGIAAAPAPGRSFSADHSRMFLWRSGWAENDSGLWLRGSNPLDFHAHSDRGHVNFIADGRAILIEAGTTNYSNPLKSKEFDSVLGHNVLQVGDTLQQLAADIPIVVKREDAMGGEAIIDAAAAYPEVERWTRTVKWERRRVVVRDEVKLRPGAQKILTFRWHLPADQPAQIAARPKEITATVAAGATDFPAAISGWPYTDQGGARDHHSWPGMQFSIRSNTPTTVTSVARPDHTLKFRRFNNSHTALEVQTASAVSEWNMETTVAVTTDTP